MKINRVQPMAETVSSSSGFWEKIFSSNIRETLDESNEMCINLRHAREEELKNIVNDQRCSSSYWTFLWPLAGSCLGMIFVLLGFVFWPTENLFLHPDTWWHCVLQCGFVWMGEMI